VIPLRVNWFDIEVSYIKFMMAFGPRLVHIVPPTVVCPYAIKLCGRPITLCVMVTDDGPREADHPDGNPVTDDMIPPPS
jgi:hypothetical protein